MPEAAELLLDANELVAGYLPGVDILNGCSLTLAENEIVGVVGPNGAGKSTLVKTMFGLVPVRGGSVTLAGDDITALPAHQLVARGVGYVPQTHNVFGTLSVEDNLRMGMFLRPKEVRRRIAAIGELFPLVADRQRPARGITLGRRAPDGGDGAGADDGAAGAAFGRALRGSFAQSFRTRRSNACTASARPASRS